MQISRADRVRMERAHVRAWPALRTADLDGWLWRSSGGGSQRANSVSTVDFTGDDPESAVIEAEARYRAMGQPARFQLFDETSPPGLSQLLRARGYQPGNPTVTMFKRSAPLIADACVEIHDHAWGAWSSVYLDEITENRRSINSEILKRVPGPRAFLGYPDGPEIVSTALCVFGYGCAVVECVTTRADFRRRGAAVAVLAGLQQWAASQGADWLGLQVDAGNTPALALYERLGFVAGATNTFWVKA